MNDGNGKKPIGALSIDVKTLCDRMRKLEIGQRIKYVELTALIARNVQAKGRSALESARYILERDNGIVFGVLRNEGLVRLTDKEIVRLHPAIAAHIRRSARRGFQKISRGIGDRYEALSNDDKNHFNYGMSLFGATAQAFSAPRLRQLEARVQDAAAQLSLTKTLEAFKD